MKKCQMPESVDVLGKKFDVSFKKMAGKWGECDHAKTMIRINPTQSRESMVDTILHEVIHAAENSVQCKMSEAQVTKLATALVQVLRHNPVLVKYLTE